MGEERVALMVFIVSPADFLGQQLLFCLIHEEVLEVFFPKRLLAQFVDERLALLFLWVSPVGPLLADGVGAVAQFRAVEQLAQHGHVGLRLSVVQIDLMAPRHPCEVRCQSRFFKLPFDVAIDDGLLAAAARLPSVAKSCYAHLYVGDGGQRSPHAPCQPLCALSVEVVDLLDASSQGLVFGEDGRQLLPPHLLHPRVVDVVERDVGPAA